MTRRPIEAPSGVVLRPGWAWSRLGQHFDHIDERSTTGDERLLSVSKVHGVIPRDELTDRVARADTLVGYKRCRAGDLIVNQMSAYDGLMGITKWDGIVTYHYLVFRPSAHVHAEFVAYVLTSSLYQQEFSRRVRGLGESTQGGVRTPHIRIGDMLQTVMALPGIEAQRAIADYLDTETARIDALIAKKQRMIELVDDRLASVRTQTFMVGAAETAALGRFVRSISQGASPQASSSPAEGEEWGLLKLSAVKRGSFVPEENKALPNEFPITADLIPMAGDLLVTRSNTPALVGESCVVPEGSHRVVLCDLIYRLRLDDRMLPDYVSHVLLSPASRLQLSSLARGSSQSMVKLRGEDIKSVQIPIRSRHEQSDLVQRFERVASQARRMTTALNAQIDLLREHRQALITAAVTGELEIPGVAA